MTGTGRDSPGGIGGCRYPSNPPQIQIQGATLEKGTLFLAFLIFFGIISIALQWMQCFFVSARSILTFTNPSTGTGNAEPDPQNISLWTVQSTNWDIFPLKGNSLHPQEFSPRNSLWTIKAPGPKGGVARWTYISCARPPKGNNFGSWPTDAGSA